MKKQLTTKQSVCLIVSFFLGNTLAIMGSGSGEEKIGYLTYIPALLLFILMILAYSFIFKKNGDKNLFEIIESSFPNVISKLFLLVIFLYSFFCAALSCGNFIFFASVSTDSQISFSLLSLFIGICIFFILSSNKKTLGRYCELILPFVLFMLFVMIIFGIFKGNLKNLYVNLPVSFKEIAKSTFFNFISPFANIFLIMLFMNNLSDNKKLISSSIKAGLISALCLSLVYFVNLLTLGKKLLSQLYYPTLFSFGVINPGLLTQRSETIYYVSYVFFDIIYISVSLFVCMTSFTFLFLKGKKLTSTKKRILSSVFSIILVLFMVFFNFSSKFYELYTSFLFIELPITLGIPAIIFLRSLFKKEKS